MRRTLLHALFFAATLSTCFATEHKLPAKDPRASIDVPEKWRAERSDEGLDLISPDKQVYIRVEINDDDSLESAIEESFAYLKRNDVRIDKNTEQKQDTTLHGNHLVTFTWDGIDQGGKRRIGLTILALKGDRTLLLLYWASPEGEKNHLPEFKAMEESIKPIGK